ncbi:adhesin [Vibrio sp. 1S139]|uniref:adhesin n=1 Tax=Vibrio sp. 1S139 TaxID=3230006 RepID=UPI00352F1513
MRMLFLTLFLLITVVIITPNAWALACYSSSEGGSFGGSGPGGSTPFLIDPSASVPEGAPDDVVVWRGEAITINVICYKDATNLIPEVWGSPEQVYFWPGVVGNVGIPNIPGIKIGFRYEGRDIYGIKSTVDGFIVPPCNEGESAEDCEVSTQVSKTITYQPIIVTGPGNFVGYNDPVNIFQLDGELGYNSLYANYYSFIQNMDILEPTKCLVELSIENNNIDYGQVGVNDVISGEVRRNVNILIRNVEYGIDCPSVKLRGYFSNVRDFANNSYIPVFDENGNEITSYGIKLYTVRGGEEVQLNSPIGDGYEVKEFGFDRYYAKLVAFDPGNIKKGKFEGIVVYSVSYL